MPRKTTIPIYDGDDYERLAELRQLVAIAERRARQESLAPKRVGDDDGEEPVYVTDAKAAFDAFVDEAADRAEMWVLEPIGHAEYRALLQAHPPRITGEGDEEEVDPEDAEWGVNVETFPKALLEFVDPDDDEIRTIRAPEFPDDRTRRRRLKRLAPGEWDTLWVAAKALNEAGIRDPKASRYGTTQSSNETSGSLPGST